jgi:hypothetical protein
MKKILLVSFLVFSHSLVFSQTDTSNTAHNYSTTLADWGTIVSGIAAILALAVSWIIYRGQSALTTQINNSQQLLSQRQILIPLWDYISNLYDIDPSNIVTPDVIKAANTLELIALCCEGNMVDKTVITRTFSEQYIKHYESIKACGLLPGLNKTGNNILNENRAAMLFYDELISAHKNHGKII